MPQVSPEISPGNCEYRGEGNSSLVVRLKSYHNEPKVLRLVKQEVSDENCINAEVIQKKLEKHVMIIKNVMKPLLGEDFVHCPFVIALSAAEVKAINKIVKNFRPNHRCHKAVRETDTYALVLHDYCSAPQTFSLFPSVGPVVNVEIKPKQGFLTMDGFPLMHGIKPVLCWFCMRQYHKMQQNMILGLSCYCPLDLCSGCPKRMLNSMKSLFHAPQNNFRLFKNGELVFSEEKKCCLDSVLDDFIVHNSHEMNASTVFGELIVKSLLKPFPNTSHCPSWKRDSRKHINCANSSSECLLQGVDCCHELPKGCILDRILKLQMLDHKELYSLYLEMLKNNNYENDQMIGILPSCSIPPHFGEQEQLPSESKIQYISRKAWEYLLAMTIKDCSLMLTFQRLDHLRLSELPFDHQYVTDRNGNIYLHSIGVIDLDMKPLSKLEDSYKRRISIMESYLQA